MAGISMSALRALVEEFNNSACDCWSFGDLEAFLRGYADDAVMVAGKAVHNGKDEIAKYYSDTFGNDMGKLETEIVDIRFPTTSSVDEPVTMATAILSTTLTTASLNTKVGISMVTYQLSDDNSLLVVQDYWD